MIQVPIFGMEHNPDSLAARRRAFADWYGYNPEEAEKVTEVIGWVPSTKPFPKANKPLTPGKRITLVFGSAVVPWARQQVKMATEEAVAFAEDQCRSGLWYLEQVRGL